MKTIPKFRQIIRRFLPVLLFFLGLGGAMANPEGVNEKIKAADRKMDRAEQVEAGIPVPRNIVQVMLEDQGGLFYTEARKPEIGRFNCSGCHNGQKITIQDAAALSHADVAVVHGEKDKPLACNTCHSAQDRDVLENAKGTRIDMDHAYELCGQCHFRQKKDWIGGAHGKRVTYWAGQRVVKNCTACHDPHTPRFAKRWPKTYSVPLN